MPERESSLTLAAATALLLAACSSDSAATNSDKAEANLDATAATTDSVASPPPNPDRWRMINFVDEFGDTTGRGAVSVWTEPLRPMSFPYHDVQARIFVDCDDAWVRFSKEPNLVGGDIRDGYTVYDAHIRVDGEPNGIVDVRQSWSGNDLTFTASWFRDGKLMQEPVIQSLSSGQRFAVSLNWHGNGYVAFQWDLTDSSERIQESCQ